MLHTPLCDLLRIRHPILQAPMAGGWTTPALVAAVTNAGGLGSLAAARTTAADLEAAIAEVRRRTDGPFGVNFLLAPPEAEGADPTPWGPPLAPVRAALGLEGGPASLSLPPSELEAQIEVALRARVPIVSFALGHPADLVGRLKDAGVLVMASVTTVAEAEAVAAAGVDVVVAQGAEAGGHRSTFAVGPDVDLPLVGTVALVPQVVDAVAVPVVAAGGIMDGRGVAAALALGAAGVQLGTRFLLATESGAFPAYRERIVHGTETDTTVTTRFTGRAARGFRNRLLRALEAAGTRPLPWPYQGVAAGDVHAEAVRRGDAEHAVLLAGQGLRLARTEAPAGDIVGELVREAFGVVRRLGGGIEGGS